MKYQDCAEALQAVEDWSDGEAGGAARLADANINPATGLATDYLNHFNEAVMLLEMLSSCPECLADFLDWQPKSYREHFLGSRFKDRRNGRRRLRGRQSNGAQCLDMLAGTMTAVLEATRARHALRSARAGRAAALHRRPSPRSSR